MKKLLLLSLLVLFGCSKGSEEEATAAKEVNFNCNPTNYIELYEGLTLKGKTKDGDDIYISFSSDDNKMMTFTNNLSYYISSGITYRSYNAPPGCSVVSKDNPNLSMYANAISNLADVPYNESHEEKLYPINRVEVEENTLNKLRVVFYANPPNAGEISWRMNFQENNIPTPHTYCPTSVSKVDTYFRFSRNYEIGPSSSRGSEPDKPFPTFEVVNQPISNFCS